MCHQCFRNSVYDAKNMAGVLPSYPPCRCSCGQSNILNGGNQPRANGVGGGNYLSSPAQAAAYIQDVLSRLGPVDHNISITLQVGFQAQGVLGQAGMIHLAACVVLVKRMENEPAVG